MKTILVPTEDHDSMPAALEAARLVGRAFDSYIEGFAVRPSVSTYVTIEPVSSLAISGAFDPEAANHARDIFTSFMQKAGVPAAQKGPAVFSCAWPLSEGADDMFLGNYGRVFDLIVLGRPGRDPQNPRVAPLEAALFESGKPVLIVPSTVPRVLARKVLVAWNGSVEQAHTNAFAMPLLRLAEEVTVLGVEGGMTPGPTVEQAAQHLRRNGVKAEALMAKPGSRSTGEVILDQASALGCDLLVKGAFTQSRLRQLMFGGTTRHILAKATLPVLMAH